MIKTVYKLVIAWVVLAALSFESHNINRKIDVPDVFPISVFGLEFHPGGLIFAGLFMLGILLALKWSTRMKGWQIWGIAVCLILLGNLAQGGLEAGFIKPITAKGHGYFYDAIKITSARGWLDAFNENQAQLEMHAQTHPPFAVLLHFEVMAFTDNQPLPVAMTLAFIASLSIWLLWYILKTLDVPESQRSLLTLLFIVVPAFNIYSAVSLEGVILTTSLLFLYGLLRIMKHGRDVKGIVCFVAGLLLTNALTFAGTFLLAIALLIAIREYIVKRKWNLMIVFGAALVLGIGVWLALKYGLGYDHLQSFMTAARIENPKGFMAFVNLPSYLMTRIEGISEMALFLSFGCLSLFFLPETLKIKWRDFSEDPKVVFLAGLAVLLLMFLTGSFRTGETARVCLFFYPYVFLVFRNLNEVSLHNLVLLAGAQTIVMQLFGTYFW